MESKEYGICIVTDNSDKRLALEAAISATRGIKVIEPTNKPFVISCRMEREFDNYISDDDCGVTPPPGRTQKNHNFITGLNKRKR